MSSYRAFHILCCVLLIVAVTGCTTVGNAFTSVKEGLRFSKPDNPYLSKRYLAQNNYYLQQQQQRMAEARQREQRRKQGY